MVSVVNTHLVMSLAHRLTPPRQAEAKFQLGQMRSQFALRTRSRLRGVASFVPAQQVV
jgi:hypothetical protein